MEDKFNVVLSGRNPTASAQDVTQKLAALFRCSTEQATALLAQSSCIVKRDVLATVADKYKRAIESTGAQCIIQSVIGEALLEFDAVPSLRPEPSTTAVTPSSPNPQATSVFTATPGVTPAPPIQTAAPVVGTTPNIHASPGITALSHQEATRIFVDKNYEYFERKWEIASQSKKQLSWNWAAFVLGLGWMAYRKMYRYSWIFIGVIGLEVIAELAFGLLAAVSTGLNLGIAISFGLKGNTWYQRQVEQSVQQTMATRTPEQARLELARKGGTNMGAAAGFIAALFVLVVLIAAIAEG